MFEFLAYDNETMHSHIVYDFWLKDGLITGVVLRDGVFPLHNFTYFQIALN